MTPMFGTPNDDEIRDFERHLDEIIRPRTAQYVLKWIRSVPTDSVPLFYYGVLIKLGLAEEPTADTRRRLIKKFGVDGAKRYLLTQMILKCKV